MIIPIRIDINETTLDGETIHYTKDCLVFGFRVSRREYSRFSETTVRKTSGFEVFQDLRQEVEYEE